MGIKVNEEALKTAASDMYALRERNEKLRQKLEKMYENLTTALDTEAGHAMEWTGKEMLLQPIENMNKVLEHVSDTLNVIIGEDGREQAEPKGVYYDKLFEEYNELDRILKNKTSN